MEYEGLAVPRFKTATKALSCYVPHCIPEIEQQVEQSELLQPKALTELAYIR